MRKDIMEFFQKLFCIKSNFLYFSFYRNFYLKGFKKKQILWTLFGLNFI